MLRWQDPNKFRQCSFLGIIVYCKSIWNGAAYVLKRRRFNSDRYTIIFYCQSHQWVHTLMNRNSHVLSRHGVNRTSPQVEIPVLQRFNVYQKGGAAHKHVIFGEIAQLVEQ